VAKAEPPVVPTPHGAAPMNATVLQLVAASAGLSAADVARVATLQATHADGASKR